MATAYVHASSELIEQVGVEPQDLPAMQRAFLFDQLGLSLKAVELMAGYPHTYCLTVEGDSLPQGKTVALQYTRDAEGPHLVGWR